MRHEGWGVRHEEGALGDRSLDNNSAYLFSSPVSVSQDLKKMALYKL
jgi:hypothetical protein